MADRKITAGTSLTAATVDHLLDVAPVVDVSDTTDSATGTTKKMTVLELFKSPKFARRAAVADADFTVTQYMELVSYTSLTATRTVSFPAAATVSGQIFTVKDETGLATGSVQIVLDPNGAETIDGAETKSIVSAYGSLTVYCNGTAFFTK